MSYGKRWICENCGEQFKESEWCKTCQLNCLNDLKENFTSGNKKIDDFIKLMQLQVNDYSDIVFEWVPYYQFNDVKEINHGSFSTIFSAIWRDGPLKYNLNKYGRYPNKKVGLKCIYNAHNIISEFLNEAKAYSISGVYNGVLQIYGISQNPITKDYIFVLEYAEGGNFDDWMNRNYKTFDWSNKILVLSYIINGLEKIHQRQMIHRDLNTKNILFGHNGTYISGGETNNASETKVYGVLPYVAPEVLKKKPYTQAADIYSFGMIMYFTATGRQPFDNHPHDTLLILNICNGIRPELNEPGAPECYINLMKKCWDSNQENRPNAVEVKETIMLFYYSYVNFIKKGKDNDNHEIERQFKKAEEHRKAEEYKKAKEHKIEPKSTTKVMEQEASHIEHSEFIIPDDLAI